MSFVRNMGSSDYLKLNFKKFLNEGRAKIPQSETILGLLYKSKYAYGSLY